VNRARDRWDQNLDPLLDTMANVVGILVMLVAVTQLSVVDAVDRIRDERAGREGSPSPSSRWWTRWIASETREPGARCHHSR